MGFKRFKVEKLIRDHLPDMMRAKGIRVYERYMEQEEFISQLKEKLKEESREIENAKDREELIEELADLLEVMQALSKAVGVSWDEVEKARSEKSKKKGSFDRRIYNPFVDIEENNPSIEYYLKKADHYPLMTSDPKK